MINQFDLSSRAGAAAFLAMSGPDDGTWDGTANKFPSFIIALCIQATEAHWNVAAPHGILQVGRTNILTNYCNISDAQITTAHLTCTTACTNALRHLSQAVYNQQYSCNLGISQPMKMDLLFGRNLQTLCPLLPCNSLISPLIRFWI